MARMGEFFIRVIRVIRGSTKNSRSFLIVTSFSMGKVAVAL